MSIEWGPWYRETLDGLTATLEAADVDWATNSQRDPWIILGQQRPSGIEYPHAMVLSFSRRRDAAESSRSHELHRIDTDIAVFQQGDALEPEAMLLSTLEEMAAVESALDADRTLGGTVEQTIINQADAFELETNIGRELVGNLQLTLTKEARLLE